MRRKISTIGVLLLALCVSGWSSALAVAISCPHEKSAARRAMMTKQDHSCCRAKLATEEKQEQEPPHCSTSAHEAMASEAQAIPVAEAGAQQAIAQPAGSCVHCVDRSEVPATSTFREANPLKRNVDAANSRKATPLAPFAALFAPQVLSRQGSPPGAQARKHLLIGVFII